MNQSRFTSAPIIAAILLLLPVLYVGSYLALLHHSSKTVTLQMSSRGRKETFRIPINYRFGADEWASTFFWPLEQIDRKMRPGAWRPPLETGGKISLEFREWREETDAEAKSRREVEETLHLRHSP